MKERASGVPTKVKEVSRALSRSIASVEYSNRTSSIIKYKRTPSPSPSPSPSSSSSSSAVSTLYSLGSTAEHPLVILFAPPREQLYTPLNNASGPVELKRINFTEYFNVVPPGMSAYGLFTAESPNPSALGTSNVRSPPTLIPMIP